MKSIRMVGLCLAAVLALGAIVASVAQAEGPEWGRCAAKKGGKYTEGNCQTGAAAKENKKTHVVTYKGKYEWESLKEWEERATEPQCVAQKKGNYTESKCETVAEKKGVPDHKGTFEKIGPYFTGVGGTGILHTYFEECENAKHEEINERSAACDHLNNGGHNSGGPLTVECASEQSTGRAVGVKDVTDIEVTFHGCEAFGGAPCETPGAEEGEVKTNTLKGELGYIEKNAKPKPKVGILLEPQSANSFVTFTCLDGIFEFTVGVGNATEGMYYPGSGHDGVIAPITPIDQSSPGFEQAFSENGEEAENEPGQFEGEGSTIHRLEVAPTAHEEAGGTIYREWARGGQSIINRVTTEGSEEIKA